MLRRSSQVSLEVGGGGRRKEATLGKQGGERIHVYESVYVYVFVCCSPPPALSLSLCLMDTFASTL